MSTAAATDRPDVGGEAHARHRAFGRAYWMLNGIEMFERLAYFGIRAVVPLYIMQATEPGGLHLSAVDKGWIYMWWAVFQSFLPIITGGYADRYGYKRVLTFAISMNIAGYVMMAYLYSYYGFFAGILVLATGTAFFKPALQGSLAQNLTKANSSLGWGIFYWVVNVGAFAAPFTSTAILGKPHSLEGWQTLFCACAGFTAVNLLLLLTFKDVPSGASKTENPLQVLKKTLVNIVEPRLITWLLIMSCFWLMMYQLWDLHPNFITDWVNSSMIAEGLRADYWPWSMFWEYGDRGLLQVPQQILLNLNAGLIILLIVPLSWMARKMRTLSAMLVGMSVATGGILVAGLTGHGLILLLGILFFSLGEMWTGPKKNEYLGLIAPPGKKAMYLGYVNIPIGVGVGLGSWLAGHVYDNYGEKATLALKELRARPALIAKAAQAADWSDSLEKIPELLEIKRNQALRLAQEYFGETPENTARTLRKLFRHDQGQITNLALLHLALNPQEKDKDRVPKALALELRGLAEKLEKGAAELSQAAGGVEPTTTPPATVDPATQPGIGMPAQPQVLTTDARSLRALAEQVGSGAVPLKQFGLSYFIHRLPQWTGQERVVAFDLVRERLNDSLPEDKEKNDAQIVAMLWDRYGNDPQVLNNLALEHLAQGTYRVRDAVAKMNFDNGIEEIEKRIGAGRTKSFAGLSAAMGADDDALQRVLNEIAVPSGDLTDQLYAYLASREHLRFVAVAKKDWARDVKWLRELIESDPAAKQIVESRIDQRGWWDRLVGSIKRLLGSDDRDRGMYERLADQQSLIHKALAVKDWTRTPQQAAQLLGLNPFEARALASAEVNRAAQFATKLLWDKYHPQYKVWIPFAAIGVVATIALGIFGQMAKRWKDMNA
ncbi:MAG: MFS transporter [Phycisphaerae bacterium]